MDEKQIKALIDAALKPIKTQIEGLELAIDTIDKKAEATSEKVQAEKPKKAAPPVEIKDGGKTFRAKGNLFSGRDKNGERVKIDLTAMKDGDRKRILKEYPSMFTEI